MSDAIRPELLTATETARVLGMGRGAFLQFRKDNPTFPKPVIMGKTKKGRPIRKWKRHQVESFIDLLEAENS